MYDIASEGEGDGASDTEIYGILAFKACGLGYDYAVLSAGIDMKMNGAAHHLSYLYGTLQHIIAVSKEGDMLGAHTECDALGLYAAGLKPLLLIL